MRISISVYDGIQEEPLRTYPIVSRKDFMRIIRDETSNGFRVCVEYHTRNGTMTAWHDPIGK